jgi:hypothetical protein
VTTPRLPLVNSHGLVRFEVLNLYLRVFHRLAQQSPLAPEVLQLALSLPVPPPALEMSLLNVLFQSSPAVG